MSIVDRLQAEGNLTEVERRVAEYIYRNRAIIKNLTLSVIARETYTSNATVIRVCRKFGFKGYREFQFELAMEATLNANAEKGLTVPQVFDGKAELENLSVEFSNIFKCAAEFCSRDFPVEAMRQAAGSLIAAERVYMYGYGEALFLSADFANRLYNQGIHPILPQCFNDNRPPTSYLSNGDTVLFISLSSDDDNPVRRDIMALSTRGCKIIMITAEIIDADTEGILLIPLPQNTSESYLPFQQRIVLESILSYIFVLVGKEKCIPSKNDEIRPE